MGELAEVCEKYDLQMIFDHEKLATHRIIKIASATITEAKLIQFLKDQDVTSSIRRTNLQDELDNMVDNELSSSDIEGAIYEKALEALRA